MRVHTNSVDVLSYLGLVAAVGANIIHGDMVKSSHYKLEAVGPSKEAVMYGIKGTVTQIYQTLRL